ncbi:MAG: hypothetical protein OEY87_05220 [Gammaproteobacteria bacterium]|nr:hypothetical protein [Gammaproteobacteria bacterium]MDH5735506.1 hypothetical protein [Gammaproteobacteria bacterium]
MRNLTVCVNDQPVFEYDCAIKLDDHQLAFLDKMDSDMDRGVKIAGELMTKPDVRQKATFVVMNLLRAMKQDDDARMSVYCAYVCRRLPHVVEVHARDRDNRIDIEFVDEH